MKSLYIAFCLALAVCGGFVTVGPTPAVAAAPKPWTQADSKELEGVVTTYLLPMMDAVNTAVMQMSTDQPKACASAKEAQRYSTAAEKALTALNDRLRAEGKDMTPMAKVNEKMAELKGKVPEMVDAFCNGDMTISGTPEEQAEARTLLGYIQQYTTAMNEALKAMTDGDDARKCVKLAEAGTALQKLDVFVGEMKAKYRGNAESIAQLDKLAGQIVTWRAGIVARREGCPAL